MRAVNEVLNHEDFLEEVVIFIYLKYFEFQSKSLKKIIF